MVLSNRRSEHSNEELSRRRTGSRWVNYLDTVIFQASVARAVSKETNMYRSRRERGDGP